MRTGLGLLLVVVSVGLTQAQPRTGVTMHGWVVDSASRQALSQATVALLPVSDSLHIAVQLADDEGRFTLRNVAKGSYRLTVSYVGYHRLSRLVVVSAVNPTLNLGTLSLRPQTVRLREVTVQRRVPVRVRQDTLEFDAGSFATRPNAVVEDLLRKLPGMDVTPDGAVRAQGQIVQQVLVDGKPFFGSDPRMATRNLPTDLIDKIQVFDQRSDQSAFSGVDDGSRVRTLNIVTKPEGRRGQFGQQVAGYGTAGRYQVGGGLNRFREQRQISLMGQANNVNQVGYSLPAYGSRSSTSTGAGSTQGQPGSITRSVGAGLNYNDRWGRRTEIAASYLGANALTEAEQTLRRQTVLPHPAYQPGTDSARSVLISHQDNRTTTRPTNHGLNLRINYPLDSMNVVRVSPSLARYVTHYGSGLTVQTLTGQQTPINQSLTENRSRSTNWAFNNTALWMHRFRRMGRTLSLSLTTAVNRQVGNGFNQARNTYDTQRTGADSLPTTQDQRNTQRIRSTTNELSVAYTEPLGTDQTVELRYNGFTNRSASERTVFDIDQTTGTAGAGQLNAGLSNQNQSRFVGHRFGSGWQVRRPRYTYTLGIDLQQARLRSEQQAGYGSINRQYVNLLPSAVFKPRLAANQYVQVQYQTRVTAPSVTQLQPVADVTNPLFVQMGNPDLRPEYTHALTVHYNQFQTTTYRTVFALLTVGLTNHRIVTATTVDGAGVQTLRPVNANGYTTAGGTVSFGRPVQVGSLTGTLNLTTNVNLIRGVSYVNGQPNRSLSLMAGQSASLNMTLAQKVEISLSGTAGYQTASYSLQRQPTQPSLHTALTTGLSGPLPFGFYAATDFTYTATQGRSAGYNQRYGLWNGYVSRSCLKQQQAELRLQVVDLLNQNRSLVRTVTDTYIEDGQSRVLKRYVLLSFIYNLRRFGTTP